jgi:hypothetical protein
MRRMRLDDFMRRYDSGTPDGRITGGETGLRIDGRQSQAPFVRDLSSLSAVDFQAVTDGMSKQAIALYLYNKYPDLFARWDNGGGAAKAMDASISIPLEMERAQIPQLVADAHRLITEERDRRLLARLDLFNRAGDNNRLQQGVLNTNPLRGAFKP